MKLSAAIVLLGCVLAMPASADYLIRDGSGTAQTVKSFTYGGGIGPQTTPVDPFGAAFGVSANPFFVGGFDSGPQFAEATPSASSHAAGTSVGGLFSVPAARISGGSGTLTNLYWKFTGGGNGYYIARLWSKNPANTTCSDNVAYAQSSETDDRYLIVPPFLISASAPANATGDGATYASALRISYDYKNADSTATPNIYECLVAVFTDTADESALIRAYSSGPQN